METDYLKEFIVLSETGNYLQAAEELFIAQSSLSKHIKALEIELGVPLFNRTPRKVELTGYGKSFLKCAQQIVDIQYSFQRDLASKLDEKQQTLRIGSIPLMAPYRITDIIMKHQRENEHCTINLFEEESFTLKELLRKNKCDLAFIREEGDTDDEFAKFPYTSDHLVAILPSTHPLAKRSAIQLEELKDENFLLLQPDSLLYSISTTACQKAGFTPNIAYTGKRAENIMDLVEKGMGVSLLMEKPILSLATPKVSIIDVTPTVSTNIYIYYKKNIPLSAAAKKFLLAAL
ncbi:MAG: LysR family transcriptional regulator [Clostridiales bacterium]|nr:LysR family transcriptional regulator [Clostridiales bacterium]